MVRVRGGVQFGIAAVFFLSGISVHAALHWELLPVEVKENIVDTEVTAPAPYTHVEAAIPFKNFRYPHLDSDLNVTFIADDPIRFGESEVKNHGIYRSWAATGKIETMIKSGLTTNQDGSDRLDYIRGLQGWRSDFVFHATWGKGEEAGLYEWTKGRLQPVAETHRPVAGLGDRQLGWVSYGSISEKRILFTAHGQKMEPGLYVMDRATRKVRQLLSDQDEMPGRPGQHFAYLSLQNWINEKALAFRGDSVKGPVHESSGNADGNNQGTRSVYFYSLANDPDLTQFSSAKLIQVAGPDTVIPETDGLKFVEMNSTPVGDNLVAFMGGNEPHQGVYVWSPSSGLACVLNTEVEIQGLPCKRFYAFDKWVAAFDHRIIFRAKGTGGYEALFLYDQRQDRLGLMADTTVPVDGKKVIGFEVSSNPLVGESFAFMARFKDGSSGIYLAKVPLKTFEAKR